VGTVWPYPAVATGVGSMPGTHPHEASNVVAGEFAAVPHVVELPARGPGSDSVGRSVALLASVDRAFEVETTTSGWRIGHAGQSVLRRAHSWLSHDLESLEEFVAAHRGPIKVQVLGPVTMAARVEDPAGEALLRDHGAVSEVAAAAASAYSDLVMRMQRSFPHAEVLVQVNEPDVPAVLLGQVRTSSGRLTHRSLEPHVVQAHLADVLDGIRATGAIPGVRCFMPRPPIRLFLDAGAQFLCVDITQELPIDDALPQAWEHEVGLLLGCVPVSDGHLSDTSASAPMRRFMEESGFPEVPAHVAITPTGGLADVDMDAARRVIAACVRVGAVLRGEDVRNDQAPNDRAQDNRAQKNRAQKNRAQDNQREATYG